MACVPQQSKWSTVSTRHLIKIGQITVSHTCDNDKEDEFQATEWTDVESKDIRGPRRTDSDTMLDRVGQNSFKNGTVKTRIVHGHQKTNSQG